MRSSSTVKSSKTTKPTTKSKRNSARPAKEKRPLKPATKRTEKLTLYDRLSHLTYKQACDILGSDGALLLRRSFPLDSLDVTNDVYLVDDLFRLSIHEPWIEPATVTVTLAPGQEASIRPADSPL